jgi:inhibitor of cysteine peptidase
MRSNRTWRSLPVFGLVLLSVCVCCVSCKRTSLTINADKSYDDRSINLHVGDGVKLSLAENPTTGYRWEFVTNPEPYCVVVSDAYVADAGGAIGSGGAHEWTFRAVSQGTGTVSLAYRRPWEKDTPPAQTFKLTMVVK